MNVQSENWKITKKSVLKKSNLLLNRFYSLFKIPKDISKIEITIIIVNILLITSSIIVYKHILDNYNEYISNGIFIYISLFSILMFIFFYIQYRLYKNFKFIIVISILYYYIIKFIIF